MIIPLTFGLKKKMLLYELSQYFPKLYERSGRNIKVKLDLANYGTKPDLKRTAVVDTTNLASKSDLTILKATADETEIDKLKTILADLSKLSNAVDDEVVKKLCDKLVPNSNAVDTKILNTSWLVYKTQYDLHKQGLEEKQRCWKKDTKY